MRREPAKLLDKENSSQIALIYRAICGTNGTTVAEICSKVKANFRKKEEEYVQWQVKHKIWELRKSGFVVEVTA